MDMGSSINFNIQGGSELSANLYCNSRTSVLGRLSDYLRLLMKRSVIIDLGTCNQFLYLDLN